ncbi:MAG: FecR family protein [Thermodesulfobacteriota bacterium]
MSVKSHREVGEVGRVGETGRRVLEGGIKKRLLRKYFKKTVRVASLTLAAFVIVATLAATAVLAGMVGTVTDFEGRADILKSGEKRATPVSKGMEFDIGDIMRTKSDGKLEITFIDKSVMRLAPKTRLKIESYLFDGQNREEGVMKLFRGKARAIVTKASRGAKPGKFEVHTPTAIAGVRGTDFYVFHDLGVSGIVVTIGIVELVNPDFPDSTQAVTAGNASIVKMGGAASPPRPSSEVEETKHDTDTTITGDGDDDGDDDDEGNEDGGGGDDGSTGGDTGGYTQDTSRVLTFGETEGLNSDGPMFQIKGPQELTNIDMADFEVSGQGRINYSYELDGAPVDETSFDNLSEGGHAFEVTATDIWGNETVGTYEWTTDYTPPELDLTGAPGQITEATGADFVAVVGSEPATLTYDIDGNITTNPSLTGLAEGMHLFTATATDAAGNSATESELWFVGTVEDNFLGGAAGTGSTYTATSVSGQTVMVTGEGWGSYHTEISGDYTGPSGAEWRINAGGKAYDDITTDMEGYWVEQMAGTYSGSQLNGASGLFYLTESVLGVGAGTVTGSYDDGAGSFQTNTIGMGTYVETPLNYFGSISSDQMDVYMGGTVSLWSNDANTTLVLGEYNPLNTAPYIFDSWFEGTANNPSFVYTTADGGAYLGSLLGEVRADSGASAIFGGIYIDPDGNAGYLLNNLEGVIYPDFEMIEMVGSMERTQMVTAASLGLSASELATNTWTGVNTASGLEGSFAGGGALTSTGAGLGSSLFIVNKTTDVAQGWGLYSFSIAGTAGAPTGSWNAVLGGAGVFGAHENDTLPAGNDDAYWIGEIAGANPDGTRLTGTLSGRFISETSMGTLGGDVIGSYDTGAGTFEAASLGTWERTAPLTHVSVLSAKTYETDAGIVIDQQGNVNAFMGGTASLWSGSDVPFSVIGAFNNGLYDTGTYANSVFFADNIFAYNFNMDNLGLGIDYTTYDGGAYIGHFGGSDVGDSLRAIFVGIYVDPAGNAGTLTGNLAGIGYQTANTFELDGTMNRTQMMTAAELGIDPGDLANNVLRGYMDSDNLAGSFNGTGSLSAELSIIGKTAGIVNYATEEVENWGTFGQTLFGTYSSPGPAWSAEFGGNADFGAYYQSSIMKNDFGFYVANINDGTFADDAMGGVLDGVFISKTKIGTLDGNLIGSYDSSDGLFEAVTLGTWQGEDVTFWSSMASALKYRDGTGITNDGNIGAYMAGSDALFTGSPVAVSLIGGNYPDGVNPHHIFESSIVSHDNLTGTDTTAEGGAYSGTVSGAIAGGGSATAGLTALYTNPGGTSAGLLLGSLSGSASSLSKTVSMDGTLTAIQMESGLSLNPTTFAGSSVSTQTVTGSWGAGLFDGTGTLTPSNMEWESGIVSAGSGDWGSLSGRLTGTYAGITSYGWDLTTNYSNYGGTGIRVLHTETDGTSWSDSSLGGSTLGYVADEWITGIVTGETTGTFNAAALSTFQAITTGAWVETAKFMDMINTNPGALTALNIPFAEVGSATLTGAGNNISVSVNNARFYSYSSGAAPKIWATDSITGSYSADPVTGVAVPISGGGLSADFTMQNWDPVTDKGWLSTVDGGTGTLSGGSYTGSVTFEGVGAGTIDTGAGTFMGTGAGTAGP